MATTVGCVSLANREGPPRERTMQRIGEGGNLVIVAPAKGDFVSVAKHYRPR